MKLLAAIGCLLCFPFVGIAGDMVVPISDSSPFGSPLWNSGVATVSEVVVGTGAVMHHTEEWTARNNSAKSIVAVVETLRVHYRNGRDAEEAFEHEGFFGPELVKPGDKIQFTSVPPTLDSKATVSQSSRPPACEVIVRWVQFADGSSFGDVTYAKDLLWSRRVIWKELKRLQDVFTAQGPAQFSLQLQQRTGTEADGYLEHLRNLQLSQGTQAAIDSLRMHLATAELLSGLL